MIWISKLSRFASILSHFLLIQIRPNDIQVRFDQAKLRNIYNPELTWISNFIQFLNVTQPIGFKL